jgi:hypothetical protein
VSRELLNWANEDEQFLNTLLPEMRHGFMDTMFKQKLSHHNRCQKGHHDRNKSERNAV